MNVPRVLVLGATGQLGLALQRTTTADGWSLQTLARTELDLTHTEAIGAAIHAARPDVIINASGYTAVDKAETEYAVALALNRDAPAAMARATLRASAVFVHVSTDYVFGGDKPAPYVETDSIAPINAYGRSKAEGEIEVRNSGARAAVLRTSWVFSAERSNFLKTMLALGETRGEVRVVSDQVGRPTGADELARACLEIAAQLLDRNSAAEGLFHFAGAGDTTWADFAELIFAEALQHGRAPVRVQRIATSEFPTLARRPANSRLETTKIENLGILPQPWLESVRTYVGQLLA